MIVRVWSNTNLTKHREVQVDEVVDLFLASRYYRPGVDLAAGLRLFTTDQDGPIQGVCDQPALTIFVTAVAARLGQLASAGKDTS